MIDITVLITMVVPDTTRLLTAYRRICGFPMTLLRLSSVGCRGIQLGTLENSSAEDLKTVESIHAIGKSNTTPMKISATYVNDLDRKVDFRTRPSFYGCCRGITNRTQTMLKATRNTSHTVPIEVARPKSKS